eukprot:15453473-Alexandrium_andersonii.AAC.1
MRGKPWSLASLALLVALFQPHLAASTVNVLSLADAFRWTSDLLSHATAERIQDFGAALNPTFTLSTAFSGVDTPGVALAALVSTLKAEHGIQATTYAHTSAIERPKTSQAELMCSKDAPACLFQGMLDFTQEKVRTSVIGVAQHLTYDKPKEIMLRPTAVMTSARCLIHKGSCACAARPAVLHVAGAPCTDWSSMGLRLGAKGATTLAFVAWGAIRPKTRDLVVIQE